MPWLAEATVQRGAEGAAGQFGEDDGGTSEAQGPWARLQGQLAAVTPPRAVGRRHYGLAVGCDRGHRSVEDLVAEVSLRRIGDLRVAAGEDSNEGGELPTTPGC